MSTLSGNNYTYLLAVASPAFDLDEHDLYPSSTETKGYVLWNLDAPFEPLALPRRVPVNLKTDAHVFFITPLFCNDWSFLGEPETKSTAVS
jgi:hypothetical protein